MTTTEADNIVKDIKSLFYKMTEYCERAQLDSYLGYFHNSPTFLHFSSDGKMRNHEEFKKVCAEYYDALKEQKIMTIREEVIAIDRDLVILAWTGNITAQFKNGDTMKMNNYSITNLFKKIDDQWKIIHSHESALPPELGKKG
jgi:ketosteroid isomerase-like protein